jgi:hypothetical protein
MPAVVPLVAFAELADQPRSRNEREVFLRAGESNELRWTMESFGALRGRIVDRDGNAVKGRLILLAAAQDREPCPLSQSGYYEDQVMSDGLGRFSFDRVAPGRWWVGPVRHVPCGHDCFVGLPIEVRIADASLDSDVLLVDQPGLSIRGRIVDGDGTSASGRVTAVDVAHGCELSAQAERDGAFLLSPLLPGNYRVQGSRLQRQAHTEPVVVAAGTDDVRLTLPAGGSLHGRVLGARDEPRTDASVFARRRGPDETRAAVIGESTRIFILASGDFRVRGVEPGTYDVWATTSEGLFDLVADVDVRAGSELSALSLSMSPGARLRLRCDDESSAGAFEVRAGGVLLYAGELRVGFTQPLVVPAGPVDIAHTARGGARRTRTVEIVAGEDRFVVSGKDF